MTTSTATATTTIATSTVVQGLLVTSEILRLFSLLFNIKKTPSKLTLHPMISQLSVRDKISNENSLKINIIPYGENFIS